MPAASASVDTEKRFPWPGSARPAQVQRLQMGHGRDHEHAGGCGDQSRRGAHRQASAPAPRGNGGWRTEQAPGRVQDQRDAQACLPRRRMARPATRRPPACAGAGAPPAPAMRRQIGPKVAAGRACHRLVTSDGTSRGGLRGRHDQPAGPWKWWAAPARPRLTTPARKTAAAAAASSGVAPGIIRSAGLMVGPRWSASAAEAMEKTDGKAGAARSE